MDLHSSAATAAGAFLLPWPQVGVKFTWPVAKHAHNRNTANISNSDGRIIVTAATISDARLLRWDARRTFAADGDGSEGLIRDGMIL